MKNLIYNCFLFLIVLIFAYINSLHTVESFAPKMKEICRPYIRNARVIGEGFYNRTTSDISNLFRKFGIM